LVPWILKALLLVAKSKRSRELLFTGTLAAVELAKSDRAQKMYGEARTRLADLRTRAYGSDVVRKARRRIYR
jgi:hypothetical protein